MDHRNKQHPCKPISRQDNLDFELIFLIEREPGLSQREIAERLGISLGRVNYCLRALLEKGVVKLANFQASRAKLRYVYVLTPQGIAHRLSLTRRYLERKVAEFERLEAQIGLLKRDIGAASKATGEPTASLHRVHPRIKSGE